MLGNITAGTQIQDYVIEKYLGQGATSAVYRARDTRQKRTVALKHLLCINTRRPNGSLPDQTQAVQQFYQQAAWLSALQHPHILRVETAFEQAGQHFSVTEYLEEAASLLSYVQAPQTRLRDLLQVLQQISEGMYYAHSQGLTHQSLSPENVAVCQNGQAKILNLGRQRTQELSRSSLNLALQTQIGYLPPEQLIREHRDQRSDIYSLGAVVYHVLTGHQAFAGRGIGDTIQNICGEVLPLAHERQPALPPALSAIVAKAMNRNPDQRYQSMTTLHSDLKRLEHMLPANLLAMPTAALYHNYLPARQMASSTRPFADFALPELLETLKQQSQTGCLMLESEEGLQGRIHLAQGQITAVELEHLALESPVERLVEMACWRAGASVFHDVPILQEEALGRLPHSLLLFEVKSCRDRYVLLFQKYAAQMHQFPLRLPSKQAPGTHQARVLRHCNGQTSVAELLRQVPLNRLTTLQTLHELLKQQAIVLAPSLKYACA